MKKTEPVVLSASRMTDMPAFFPTELISEVEQRLAKGIRVHTLVLWTKHPKALLQEPLYSFLCRLKEENIQISLQVTISGMGGLEVGVDSRQLPVIIEPQVPPMNKSLALLPQLVVLTGKAERILLRIDPIIRIADANGTLFSNLNLFETILSSAADVGIKRFTFSFLEKGIHAKVDKRFDARGLSIQSPNEAERAKMRDWIAQLSIKYGVISACCVAGMSPSACIDGLLLEALHNQNLPVSCKQPKSRVLCGCTRSIDLGGWPPRKCASGCLYCYANPMI